MVYVKGMTGPIDKETKLIREKYTPAVVSVLQNLIEQRTLSKVCRERLGMGSNRFSEIARGKRLLTFYYLHKLFQGGIVDTKHILQGRKRSDLPPDELRVLRRLELSDRVVDLATEAQEAGINVENLLENVIPKSP